MEHRKFIPPEVRTQQFFEKPARSVVKKLAAKIYELDANGKPNLTNGQAKTIQLSTEEGDRYYEILVAQPYAEEEAMRIWKGKRAEEIRAMQSGETITYAVRAGILTFIKTMGADNILLRALRDYETGQILKNPTEVSNVLQLTHQQTGKLTLATNDLLRFHK